MGNTTINEIPDSVNNYYDRIMLIKARALFVHKQFAQVKKIPANSGTKTIKFRRYSFLSPATTPLTEGVTPTGSQLTVTSLTCSTYQYGDYIKITDVVKYTTSDPILNETADILSYQARETYDELTRDILAATTTQQFAASATSEATVASGMKLNLEEIQEAVLTLKTAKARKMTNQINAENKFGTTSVPAAYIAIAHQKTVRDLKNADGWTDVKDYAGQIGIYEGEVGYIDEVRVIETTEAYVGASAGASSIDVYRTIILAMNAYGTVEVDGQSLHKYITPAGGGSDPLHQRTTYAWKGDFTAKILNDAFMVAIYHAVSA
ncbi:MAG: N4-gp56 family major capsid protein [Nanoarchaeota archaeon]|nr:N4-gp56 family major capsid protein [Nanoarchaeota archaeon]